MANDVPGCGISFTKQGQLWLGRDDCGNRGCGPLLSIDGWELRNSLSLP